MVYSILACFFINMSCQLAGSSHIGRDTVDKYVCNKGGGTEIAEIRRIPIGLGGGVFYRTSFSFNSEDRGEFDYIGLSGDTVYVIKGVETLRIDTLANHKAILCILTKKKRTYRRQTSSNCFLFNCLTFEDSHFSVRYRKVIYRYKSEECSQSAGSDMPFLKEISFSEDGKITDFVFDRVQNVLSCKLDKNR